MTVEVPHPSTLEIVPDVCEGIKEEASGEGISIL
jgi:hypothetical protein